MDLWLYQAASGPAPARHPPTNKDGAPLWCVDVLLGTGPTWPTVLLRREQVADPEAFLTDPDRPALGLALELHGLAALPRYAGEEGLHVFTDNRQIQKCLVETAPLGAQQNVPPPGIARRGAVGTQERRRLYDRKQALIDDPQLPARRLAWDRPLAEVLGGILRDRLRQNLQALLE